jgi:protein-S-isoprenylcysteine O-methyltransferase Ste14
VRLARIAAAAGRIKAKSFTIDVRRLCSGLMACHGSRSCAVEAAVQIGAVRIFSLRIGHAMSKAIAVFGSALFFVIAPLALAAVVPWWITGWQFQPAFLGAERVLGGVLIIAGVPGLVDSFARFALEGLGTPAPVAPTQKLIVTGLYRYVRNPMYIAVVAVILGQALLFGDERLLSYGALFWLACHVFVVTYEEPTLRRTFGLEYEAFRANVPRWIPRLTPWRAV